MSTEKTINFMGQRKIAAVLSVIAVILSVASLSYQGLSFGLDFTGGTSVELHYEESADLAGIREQLKTSGYPGALVANFGTDQDVQIRIQTNDAKVGDAVVEILRANSDVDVELKRISYVGPQIGEELRDDGGIGMIFALAVVMAYVALRFQVKFSIGAVTALIHDVLIVLGLFSILRIDFDLTVLAAVLAVVGYSLNDTIVVSDRIRENFRKLRKESPVDVINISLTQTLGRTLVTSLTTLLVLLALFFVGGELIHNFASALIVGVLVGTYSSIYVASNVLLAMNVSSEDLIQVEVEKEGADQDEIVM